MPSATSAVQCKQASEKRSRYYTDGLNLSNSCKTLELIRLTNTINLHALVVNDIIKCFLTKKQAIQTKHATNTPISTVCLRFRCAFSVWLVGKCARNTLQTKSKGITLGASTTPIVCFSLPPVSAGNLSDSHTHQLRGSLDVSVYPHQPELVRLLQSSPSSLSSTFCIRLSLM